MLYGLLLVSERQGMGKSTLGERILAPLVGYNNTGFPGERDIVDSNFNGWIAKRRLVVIGEIYTGQSFKAYNLLKTYITDKHIDVNEKYQRQYKIENWAHILACSNSRKALRIENSDRRWFYPLLNEEPWGREKFGEFYGWLASGGLGIIARWAEEYGDYVLAGETSPMTATKAELIRFSKGDVLNEWADALAAIEEEGEEVVFALSEVTTTMRERHKKMFETANELRKEAVDGGWWTMKDRVVVDGVLSYVVGSPAFEKSLESGDPKYVREKARAKIARLRDRLSVGF